MKGLALYAGWLVVLGALVVGLQGLLQLDVLGAVLGENTLWTRAVEVLIGLSGVMLGYKMLMGKKG
ncbi:hypothetical protein A2631_02160 [Candidatus Daviesbacteria bacterium RIFCSPHIGHO2_01_FULL_44_29]|uniref:DUF378 domain-containing protein n=1 Tax=Candidatus Daviesbacteria bacterium RIFCSPHIGHO2_02_FULL_43_12 TaxID=1797776 RepID=A0A1F5KJW1_9BACT|nr:MAG: hypothetical protein A2631_02160 [Candidatus Daviesbacteria bacterium RIFCSPHIGHO2_01_FULL_44_29]OGE39526.1 MAG: hypothetical protein A3E86_01740 [Candidatus Daviesbacteria bacterium RIFCSPHIGHO2_12_FULL_47_45]OGE41198.1 MAG: hypothetical protein A3D25_01555 [Candidatus Daviesbacteria bacterium RIFCSPHIGHO2_02_FULL_43_12]OGE69397.1 MAG: hypothetical protein A3B55_03295 [Candidatus Daviesbacteria bacterium RIFCSPLOWO2_01_FULL_43_15]